MVKNWDSVKSIIHHLYVTQEQSLDEVRDVMIRQYNFVASDRAYKNKIPEWGWRTNQNADGRIATIRRRPRRRRVNIMTNSQRVVSHDVGASVAVVRESEFRALDPSVSSGQLRSSDFSNTWNTLGSVQVGAVGQDYPPETHEAEHGFVVTQQSTSPRSESDAMDQQDNLGRTLLHRMVTAGELDNVKDILSKGAKLDIQDNDDNQPLHLATIGNYPHIIKYLLKSGAKMNAKGVNGKTPVHLALGLPKALRTLLCANPNLSTSDNDGDTALHVELRRNSNKRPKDGGIVAKLLRCGANVNSMNHSGVTPFHMAMKINFYIRDCYYLSLFLDHDALYSFGLNNVALQLCKTANIHTPSVTGDLPLHYVLRSWVNDLGADQIYLKLAEALLYRGSDPNQSNGKGEYPIQVLLSNDLVFQLVPCRRGKLALLKLLDHGADPMPVGSSGDLPICIAYRQIRNDNRDEVVRILTDAFIARPEHINEGNKSPPIPIWWQKYRTFRLERHWTSEATQLFKAASSGVATGMPPDVAEHLPKLLISFAAEDILQAAETRLNGEGINRHSVLESFNVVNILRDCKNMGIDMDTKWYHFLLDVLP